MGVKYGNDYPYADRSLKNTFIVHNGLLIHINMVNHESGRVEGTSFNPKTRKREPWSTSLDQLNLRPFQLGYINRDGRARYITRSPSKQWRQGHVRRNLYEVYHGSVRGVGDLDIGADCINFVVGEYPTLEAIEQMFKHNVVKSVAFHRRFALDYEPEEQRYKLHRRGDVIGVLDGNFQIYKMSKNCECFEEEAKEVLK